MRKVEQELEIRKREIAWKKKYDELYLGMLMQNERHKQRIQSKKLKEDVYKCDNAWHTEPHLESLNGRDDWLVEQIEYGECSICGHELLVEDYERGELICEGCGTVASSQVMDSNVFGRSLEHLPSVEEVKRNLIGLRKDEMKVVWLERRRKAKIQSTEEKKVTAKKPLISTDKSTHRKRDYIRMLKVIANQLHMNKNQIAIIEHVINMYSLDLLHKTLGHQTIIAALCRYILCREGRGRELRFSRDVFKENNLTQNKYNSIVKNVEMLRIFRH